MYVGNRHTAQLEATYFRRFTCKACGFESLARVRAKGEGQASSPFFLREQGAKDAARGEAELKAEENANALAQLGRCPSCDARDESAVSAEKTSAWLGGLGLGAVFAVLAGFVFARHDLPWLVYAVGAVVIAALHVQKHEWKWGEADERVRVLSHSEVESLLAEVGELDADADEEGAAAA